MNFKGKEIVSVGKSCHSEGICILVVNDDVVCSNIVFEMLQFCSYEVLHVGDFLDVFNVMWGIKGSLNHVVTNVHYLETDGAAIALRIEEKLSVHVLLMNHGGGEKIKSKGNPFSFTAYVVNGLSMTDVDQLWQYALVSAAYQQNITETASLPDSGFVTTNVPSSISEPECLNQRGKRSREKYENSEDDKGDSVTKKTRVIWTAEMHQKFLKAIEIIGYEKAVPKKIVEVMAIPGLTRENVASHLQKFRGSLKRTQVAAHSRLRDTAGSLQFFYLSSVDTIQQRHQIPGLQLNPSFRVYSDNTRNILLSLSNDFSHHQHPRTRSCTFVGYRLASDGSSIEFGKPGELMGVDAGSVMPAQEIQGNKLSGQIRYSPPSSSPQIIEEFNALLEDDNDLVRETRSTNVVGLHEFD